MSDSILDTIHGMFGTDKDKESKGIVVKFGKLRLRLARMGGNNERFANVFTNLWRPYSIMQENGVPVPEEVHKTILHQAYAEAILLEWGHEVTAPDGTITYTEVPYTPQDGIKAFGNDPDFFQFVLNESKRQENFRVQTLKADEKN